MKTRVESLQKNNNNEPIFQQTKFSVLELGLTDRRNLTGTWPKSACGKSSSCRFSFSAARRSVFLTNDCDFLNDHGVERFFMFLGSLFNISF